MNKEEIFNILYDKEKWEVYRRFQEIENDIDNSDELYQYFDDIKKMLSNEKSYIRVRGFRLICKLAKYDKDKKVNLIIEDLLNELDDDRPTNVRQCLSYINILLEYKPELSEVIKNKVKMINYLKYKESMSPLIKKDMDYILKK